IESWCLRYAWAYISGSLDLGSDPAGYAQASQDVFARFTGSGHDGVVLRSGLDPAVLFWVVVFALNLLLVYRGLSKGIERFCQIAMPAMAVCAVIVLIRVLTLGTPDPTQPERSVINGLGFMWNPDLSKL